MSETFHSKTIYLQWCAGAGLYQLARANVVHLFPVLCYHIGSLLSAMVEVFMPQKSADIKIRFREFPGGPVVGLHASTAEDTGLIPGQGTRIPRAMWHGQKKNQIYFCSWRAHC